MLFRFRFGNENVVLAVGRAIQLNHHILAEGGRVHPGTGTTQRLEKLDHQVALPRSMDKFGMIEPAAAG